jgi:hypothetical protein
MSFVHVHVNNVNPSKNQYFHDIKPCTGVFIESIRHETVREISGFQDFFSSLWYWKMHLMNIGTWLSFVELTPCGKHIKFQFLLGVVVTCSLKLGYLTKCSVEN